MPSSFWRIIVASPSSLHAQAEQLGDRAVRQRLGLPAELVAGDDAMRVLGAWRAAHRHVFFFFQRRSPRTPLSFLPR